MSKYNFIKLLSQLTFFKELIFTKNALRALAEKHRSKLFLRSYLRRLKRKRTFIHSLIQTFARLFVYLRRISNIHCTRCKITKLRLSESKENLFALPSVSSFVEQSKLCLSRSFLLYLW